jgi:hypothetical protein
MTTAQEEALARVAASSEPIKLHANTARILHERYSFIAQEGNGWVLAPGGRSYLDGEQADKRRRAVEQQLSSEDREWAERVLAWMLAHGRVDGWTYGHKSYAKHVAACDHADLDPVLVGKWADGAPEYVEQAVREAADCLTDFDAALKLAEDRGVGVNVVYSPEEKVPRSRQEATAAASDGLVVRLSTYRERRPSRSGAA